MSLAYSAPEMQVDFATVVLQSPDDEVAYAVRLREVENALLCLAFGGQVPQPDSQQRLQRYLNGKISRAEALPPLYHGR